MRGSPAGTLNGCGSRDWSRARNGKHGGLRLEPPGKVRVKCFGESFDTEDEAGTRPGEITIGVQRVHATVADGRQSVPGFRVGHGAVLVAATLGRVPAR